MSQASASSSSVPNNAVSNDENVLENRNKILAIGTSSILWDYFGFPCDNDHNILSRKEVRCKLCQQHKKMANNILAKMWQHLKKCHQDLHENLCKKSPAFQALNSIPSSPLLDLENLDRYELDEYDTPKDLQVPADESEADKQKPFNDTLLLCIRTLQLHFYDLYPEELPVHLRYLFHDKMREESNDPHEIYDRMNSVQKKLVTKLETLSEYSISIEDWSLCGTVSVNYLEGADLINSMLFTNQIYGKGGINNKTNIIKTLETEWGLKKEKIVAVVTGVKCEKDRRFKWDHQFAVPVVPCFLDFLDRLVQKYLFVIPLIKKTVDQHVKYYSKGKEKELTTHKMQDYWDNYYLRLKRSLKDIRNQMWLKQMGKEKLQAMRHLASVLDILYQALETFRREHPYGMVSILWPILNKLVNEHFVSKNNDGPILKNMKEIVLDYTNKKYSKVMSFLQAASTLDPRFRSNCSLSGSSAEVEKVLEDLAAKYQDVEKSCVNLKAELRKELTSFCANKQSDFLFCPIKWWDRKNIQDKYPLLHKIARRFQCIPSSRIMQKRLLNDYFLERREYLEDTDNWYLGKLLCMWSNYKLVDYDGIPSYCYK